ncbi:hypothetical protein OC835_002428 [Tilletia horrida]|nr:hypothetical protein OC835_002428 [Tilletia horrida]
MSGLQRSSSVRTNASSRSSSSRYPNLGGTIVHKVRLDDPVFDAAADPAAAALAAARRSRMRSITASSSTSNGTSPASSAYSHASNSPRHHAAALLLQPPPTQGEDADYSRRSAMSGSEDEEEEEEKQDDGDNSSSEGSEDDYGEAEEYPPGPGQQASSSYSAVQQPMSSAQAYLQQHQAPSSSTSKSASKRGISEPPLPPDAAQRAQQYSLDIVQEQSGAEEAAERERDTPITPTATSPTLLPLSRPSLPASVSQNTIRDNASGTRDRAGVAATSLQRDTNARSDSPHALASELQKMDVLDAYSRSDGSDLDAPSPASAVASLPESAGSPPRATSRLLADARASLYNAAAHNDAESTASPQSFATALSAVRPQSIPRSESTNSDDLPLCAKLGEDAALAIQKKLIREDRERQVEEALRAIERGGRSGSAKEKRAAEVVKQQEAKALAQAQAQIAAQQAQIQVLLQAQQQLLQHAAAKQQQKLDPGSADTIMGNSSTPSTVAAAINRVPSNSKSIYAARQAKAAAASASATSGLHRAKTHAASSGVHPSSGALGTTHAPRTPRRAETISPAAIARSVGLDAAGNGSMLGTSKGSPILPAALSLSPAPVPLPATPTAMSMAASSSAGSAANLSGFVPGSEAEMLMMRAAAACSPRATAAPATMAGPAGALSPLLSAPGGGGAEAMSRRPSNASGAPPAPASGSAGMSGGAEGLGLMTTSNTAAAALGLTPAQEIMAAAKAGLGLKASGMGEGASASVSEGISASMSAPSPAAAAAVAAAAPAAAHGSPVMPSSALGAPAAASLSPVPVSSTPLQQLRVYIVNRQRYGTVLVRPDARAREVTVETLEQENVSVGGSEGGWVVWDVCPGMGIERPLREYEIISQVTSVRANVADDYFLLKRTELAPYLGLKAVPTMSPVLAGYVYVEDRKKKWTKRWLELREHSLYHAKSEKGKDEVFICSLSTFDVYLVDTGKIKTPRPHAFAIRSQNNITMFEKPDQDYVHYFCLSDPVAHRSWVRAILNARTYVLKQEQAALFKVPAIASGAAPAAAAGAVTGANGTATPVSSAAAAQQQPPVALGVVGPAEVGMGAVTSLARHASLSRSRSSRRPPGGGPADGAAAAPVSVPVPVPAGSASSAAAAAVSAPQPTLMAQLLASSAGGAGAGAGVANAASTLARARTTSVGHSHVPTSSTMGSGAPIPGVPPVHRSVSGAHAPTAAAAAAAARDMFSGAFAKGSLLESMAVSGAGRNGLGAEVSSSQAFLQAQAIASTVQQQSAQVQYHHHSQQHRSHHQQQQQQQPHAHGHGHSHAHARGYGQSHGHHNHSHGPSAYHQHKQHQQQQQQQQQQTLLDFSVHEKTRARMVEEARKREMVARMRRAREEGRPLVEEAGMRR